MSKREQPSARVQMPLQTRAAPITSVDPKTRTVSLVFTTGARVKRRHWVDWDRHEDYYEELSLQPGHVRLERLNGGAPLLNTHGRWSLADVIGVVEPGTAKVDGAEGRATVRFSEREDVAPIFKDVETGIVRNVSAGYVTHRIEKLPPDATSNGLPIWRAVDWEPMELSFVPIGADAGAGVRSEQHQQRMFPCEISEAAFAPEQPAVPATQRLEPSMNEEQRRAAEAAAAATQAQQQEQQRAATEAANRAAETERARVLVIDDLCQRHGLDAEFRTALIKDGKTEDQVRAAVLDKLAAKTTDVRGGSAGDIHIVGDQRLQMRTFMAEAVLHRAAPTAVKTLSDGARQYRGMSLLRMAEEVLTVEGVKVRGLTSLEIATRSMMSTSDFPNILADVANKRLRAAYEENMPTYTRWARRAANAPDFKNINVAQLSGAPDLQKVVEGGEFKMGSLSDGKETYAIITYGRIIPLTRQAIINDDLNAFDRLPRAFSGSARRLENYLVYQQLLANGNMADGVALFHNTHGNLASATAISDTNLGTSRALMRAQTGLQGEKLNLAPKFLLAGVAKEQEAYKYTSAQFVPAQASNVNEFRAGGRTALEPIVDAEITGNKWFLAADPADCDTVEFCYLDGSEGVFLESQLGFDIDGVKLKARLDFAAKVIDHRGLTYNPGA